MTNNILDNIRGAKTVLIVGHMRPDGDCIGSCLALREYCHLTGINDVDVAVPSNITDYYSFIKGTEDFNDLHHSHYDLMVILDCGSKERFGRLDVFFKSAKRTILIDHHTGYEGYARFNLIRPEASSTCEILFDLMEPTGLINLKIAEYLFVGLSTDTGHFMHNNVTPRVFLIASKLASYGVNVSYIAMKLNRERTKGKTALIARALGNIRYYDDCITIIPITLNDINELGLTPYDSDGIIDYALAVRGTEVGVSMCEESQDMFKISFRSNTKDVAKVASVFGGGGHTAAAGAKIEGDLETVINKILEAIRNN